MEIVDREGSLDLEAFLRRPLFAHLATTDAGIARESPVWFLWEDGALWILTNRDDDSFPRRIEREPRCAVGIVDYDPAAGVVQHVGFRGRAAVVAFDRERAVRKLRKYLGPDESRWDRRRFALRSPSLAFVRFVPETAVVRDQSYAVGGAMRACQDNVTEAARRLGVARSTVYRVLRGRKG